MNELHYLAFSAAFITFTLLVLLFPENAIIRTLLDLLFGPSTKERK